MLDGWNAHVMAGSPCVLQVEAVLNMASTSQWTETVLGQLGVEAPDSGTLHDVSGLTLGE